MITVKDRVFVIGSTLSLSENAFAYFCEELKQNEVTVSRIEIRQCDEQSQLRPLLEILTQKDVLILAEGWQWSWVLVQLVKVAIVLGLRLYLTGALTEVYDPCCARSVIAFSPLR